MIIKDFKFFEASSEFGDDFPTVDDVKECFQPYIDEMCTSIDEYKISYLYFQRKPTYTSPVYIDLDKDSMFDPKNAKFTYNSNEIDPHKIQGGQLINEINSGHFPAYKVVNFTLKNYYFKSNKQMLQLLKQCVQRFCDYNDGYKPLGILWTEEYEEQDTVEKGTTHNRVMYGYYGRFVQASSKAYQEILKYDNRDISDSSNIYLCKPWIENMADFPTKQIKPWERKRHEPLNETVKNPKLLRSYLLPMVKKIMSLDDKARVKYEKDRQVYYKLILDCMDEKHSKVINKMIKNMKDTLLRNDIMLSYKEYNRPHLKFKNDDPETLEFERTGENYLEYVIYLKNIHTKRVKPKKYVYHYSKKENREGILRNGIQPQDHKDSKDWKFDYELEYPKAIFAVNNDDEWRPYDKWQIDVEKAPNKWWGGFEFCQ